jgi:GNAT superfamily N-acetyltransferase
MTARFQRGPVDAGLHAIPEGRDPYQRMVARPVASWKRYAEGSVGALVREELGATVCVFPEPPERLFYNNTLLNRGREPATRRAALETMEAAYAHAGVEQYAAWVHEADTPMIGDLLSRGYRFSETTRAMSMQLDELAVARPELDLGEPDWNEYLRIIGAPSGLLQGVDAHDFHVYIARLDGRNVATAMAFDHEGDCGIYNLVTLPEARRRGLATALTSLHLHEAKARGCSTASLQSTAMATSVYASVGFRDLGGLHEYVRPQGSAEVVALE